VLRILQLPFAVGGAALLCWRRPRPRPTAGWSWERLSEVGPELDGLWERERPADRATLCRDTRTLNWLYFEGPRAADNYLLVGRDGHGKARALAGFHREADPSLLRQVDGFGALDSPGAWASLVGTATRLAGEQGIPVVRFWAGDEAQGRSLTDLGLEIRPCRGAVYSQAVERAAPAGEPLFTDLDGDRCVELLL